MKESAAPSMGLQKVVISTSSMQSSVLSGTRSACSTRSLSVFEISAFSTHVMRSCSESSAAACTLAFESFRHSMMSGMHSKRQGPKVRGARFARSEARLQHSTLERPPPPTTCMPS